MNWQRFLCVILILSIFSCNKSGNKPPAIELTATPDAIKLAAAKNSTASFTINATMNWTIAVIPASPWLKTNITEGAAGDHEIVVTALDDNFNAERTATITITPKDQNNASAKQVTVKQESKAGAFTIDKTELFIAGIENEIDSFKITSNIGWTVSTNAAWLTIGTPNGSNNSKIEVTNKSENLTGAELTGAITVTPALNGIAPHVINVKQVAWSRAFGGASLDEITASAKSADGGLIMAGTSESTNGELTGNHGKGDFWLIRTDAAGKKLWQKVFGGSGIENAKSVTIAPDGGFVVTGSTRSIDGDVTGAKGNDDIWVIKTDANGNLVWQKVFGGSGWDKANHMLTTSDGGLLLTGETTSTDGDFISAGNKNLFLMKLNSTGGISWVKNYGGSNTETGTHVLAATDGGYLVTATTSSIDGDVTGNSNTIGKVWVLKTASDGSLQWANIINHTHFAIPNAAIVSGTGFIVCGKRQEANLIPDLAQQDENVFVARFESTGINSWTKTFGGTSFDNAAAITPAHGGGFIMSGHTQSNNGDVSGNKGDYDIWLLKIDDNGNKLWQKALGGNFFDQASGILQAPNNAYWVTGVTNSDQFNRSASKEYSGLLMKIKE